MRENQLEYEWIYSEAAGRLKSLLRDMIRSVEIQSPTSIILGHDKLINFHMITLRYFWRWLRFLSHGRKINLHANSVKILRTPILYLLILYAYIYKIQARICLYMSPPTTHHSISQGKDLIKRIWEGIDAQWLVKRHKRRGKIEKLLPSRKLKASDCRSKVLNSNLSSSSQKLSLTLNKNLTLKRSIYTSIHWDE